VNIIEREIAEREELIAAKSVKLREAEELLHKATALKDEADAIDAVELEAEIVELKGYLPVSAEDAVASVEESPVVNA